MFTVPQAVLAVHDLGFAGVQLQPQLRQPRGERLPDLPGLALGHAMHHRVVVTLEFHRRELPLQEYIERVMQEQIRQYWRYRRTL